MIDTYAFESVNVLDLATHVYASQCLIFFGWGRGLWHVWYQAISSTKDELLSIKPSYLHFCEILLKIKIFSFKEIHLNMSAALLQLKYSNAFPRKCHPFYSSANYLGIHLLLSDIENCCRLSAYDIHKLWYASQTALIIGWHSNTLRAPSTLIYITIQSDFDMNNLILMGLTWGELGNISFSFN